MLALLAAAFMVLMVVQFLSRMRRMHSVVGVLGIAKIAVIAAYAFLVPSEINPFGQTGSTYVIAFTIAALLILLNTVDIIRSIRLARQPTQTPDP
jgi:uncharacterized membrane protein YdfJ with MMPL/SSD domain